MIAENVVLAVLKANARVVALVGARLYPADGVPQASAMPVITHDRISSADGDIDLEGSTDPDQIRVQLNCWGSTYDSAYAVAAAVRRALQSWSGITDQGDAQLITCGAPHKAPKDQTLKLFGFHLEALVTIQEAAEAA